MLIEVGDCRQCIAAVYCFPQIPGCMTTNTLESIIKLVTDSTSYIDQATRDELDIKVVNLSVHFPEVSYDETEIE